MVLTCTSCLTVPALQVFGLEYDLDVYNLVAVDDFTMGAMENKSLNIFNSKFVLASPETTTGTNGPASSAWRLVDCD